MRQKYRLTQKQFDTLMESMQPVPLIMLQCGMPRSQQERANDAWKRLGDEMGFDGATVEPAGRDQYDFTAVPKESREGSHE